MSKRKYTKSSEYWKKFNTSDHPSHVGDNEETSPELLGEPFYTSEASYNGVSEARRQGASTSGFSGSRTNRAAYTTLHNRYSSISSGLLPYEYSSEGITCRDAIELCQSLQTLTFIWKVARKRAESFFMSGLKELILHL